MNKTREYLISKLYAQGKTYSGWGDDIHRITTALFLAGGVRYVDKKEMRTQLDLHASLSLLRLVCPWYLEFKQSSTFDKYVSQFSRTFHKLDISLMKANVQDSFVTLLTQELSVRCRITHCKRKEWKRG